MDYFRSTISTFVSKSPSSPHLTSPHLSFSLFMNIIQAIPLRSTRPPLIHCWWIIDPLHPSHRCSSHFFLFLFFLLLWDISIRANLCWNAIFCPSHLRCQMEWSAMSRILTPKSWISNLETRILNFKSWILKLSENHLVHRLIRDQWRGKRGPQSHRENVERKDKQITVKNLIELKQYSI